MSLTERIYGKETAGKPAVSLDTQKNLYTAAANKKPSLANRIAQNGGQPTLYADAAAKQKPSLAGRIEANGGTPYADAAAQMKSGNAAKGTSVVFNSVYGKADDRASSAGSGKYADILKASDYTELSKSGESKRKLFGDARYDYINNIGNFRAQSDVQQAQGRGQDYGKYAFMTDDEIGVYNYLYATQGKKAANAYLSDLEPELDKQWYTGTNRATTEALGKNAATRTLASAMTVAAQPTRTITSMIAMADDAVRTAKGQEINPYSKWRQASNITQELRADTSQHIEEANPGMGGKVGSFVYNTAMSAADSAMNALVAKGIGEAVGLTGDTLMKATNILGSALMSSEVASLSIAESKEKGYSNAGALALGLTRGAIEYASEAVGGEWVIRKIKANPLSFVKSMALTMIPEGMEEVMSDAANGVVNLAIDAAFGTEESGIPKMLEYYRTSGTDWQKKHAELATVLAVLGQEGLSFLGGALATLGSSGVQYSTNRANINQTAERLDTTPKNVVQMMQDAQTENPGVLYALAELTDAENADDLRQKIGTKEDMKRAAEYLTQQMEAGGRSGTQEGVYTAGGQNAPVGAQRAQNEGNRWIDETYESIRSDLKGGKLYVSKDMWRDFSKDEARELRERARAAGITLSDNRRYTPPDVRNIELAEKYGEALFPTDISAPDMLRNIIYCAEQGANEKQTLADRLWDEAKQEGLGEAREHAYERMVNDLRDKTEVILREFAEDNHLKLKEQTKAEAKPVSYFDLKKAPAKEFDRKKGDYNIIGEIGSYTKEIAELENALETENRYVISEGEARYEARIEEENGVLYASVWKNGERLAGASSRKRKNLPNWAAMEIRKDIGARIMFHPGLENRGESYNADIKAAEEAGYPVFEKKNGEKVQTVPFWTWLKSKEYGNYGLVIDKTNAQDADGNPIVFAYYFNKKKGTGKVVMESRETAYVVDGKYSDPDAAEKRAARMKDEESEAMRAEEREALWRETQKGSPFEAQPNATTDTRERATKATSAGVQRLFQQLISKGKTEVSTQGESGIRTYTAKMNTNGVEYWVDISDGRQDVQRFREFEKEKAAQLAAEWMDKEANRAYTAANEKRAEARRAELSAEENAKIAELFGNTEELKTAETPEDAPSPGETAESRVTDEIVKAEKSFRENLADVTHGAMRMFVNAGETVRRISKQTKNKSLEGYYFNAGAYSQRAGNWIAKGGARTDISGHKTGESLMDILGDIMKTPEKYKDFQLMLLHRNNVDRMRYDSTEEVQNLTKCVTTIEDLYPKLRGLDNDYLYQTAVPGDKRDMLSREWKETVLDELLNGEMPEIADISEAAQMLIFTRQKISEAKKNGLKPVFGYEVTAYDSQLEAERLLKANPEFDALAKRVYAYFDDLLQYRIDAGLDTQKHVDAMKKRYPNYVPTMRVEGTEGKTARRARRNGGIVVSNAIGRAVGGDAVIMPLHTAMSRKTVAVMKNAGLNQFGEQLVQSWNQDKSIPGVNKVEMVDYSSTDQYVDSEELYVPVTNNVFSVLRGNDRYNITMDEGLAQALNAFQPDKYANSDVAKLLKKGNDLFKALCTGYNPIFMVRNLVRDAQDAAFYSTDSATWAKMFPSAWKQIVTNGEIWQQYKALGGSYASMLDYTTGMVKEPKSAAGKLAAKYESLGQAIEAAPRLAEFMTILANKGGSKTADGVKTGKFTQSDLMEAMLGAADITTNFARGGTVTKMLNKYLVPFLNPSVQGADKFVRNITDRKGFKAWASLAIKAAALGILPELLNGLLYRDDDEWDDIPDQTKSNYYLFKLGDGYWMKIPRGRALAVFSAGATYAQEKAKGNDPKFSDVIEVVKSNVAPTDIFNQNIATAWTQTKLFNPDNPGTTWYGGNIESDRLQNYRPGERYDEKTDELSKWIGKTFNLSPKKINYLLDQYSGVVGDLLLPWLTPSATASSPALAPLKQAFMLDSTSTNKTTGEYYDLLDDLKYDANDGDIGAGITRKYVSHAGDEVNDYYQQIRAIQSDENLTKAEKNRLVRALKSQLIERQKEIIAQAEPYREAVSDYLKAHPELSTDNDAAIAEYAELYGITEDQAESRMDAIVYREANREVFGAEYALRTYNADVYDKARAAYAKGVSYDTYYDYYFATKEMHADKDENGKSISGSKKAKVVEFINSLDIPPEQKDALYVAAGYTAKSARNQKWNGGSGGSGGRRGRGKRTALKAPTPKAPEIIIPRPGTASSAKAGGTSKTPKVSGNVIADFTKTASGTDIQKAVTQAKRKALKAGNRTVYVEEGSPIDYFLKYGKLPSLK